ncbi:MAG: S9 family peptidase [Rikenellaceae bacterium]
MRNLILSIFMAIFSLSVSAQKTFDYEDLIGGLWNQKSVSGGDSMNDGEHYTVREDNKIVKYSYKDGSKVGEIIDFSTFEPKISVKSYTFSADEKKLVLTTNVKPIYRHSFTAEYWICDIETSKITKLSDGGAQQVATLSPDGSKVAFVRDNNLFWVDLSTMKETQITEDGKFNYILNGIPDWVYEEEYGFSRAFEWSPESDKIAYYRTNEERVSEYNMNTFKNELYPENYSFKYPKAGEQNSIVSIYCHDLATGERVKMNIGDEDDQYIPRIMWSKIENKLAIARLNRLQNNFDLLLCDVTDGTSKTIYNEQNSRYVERVDYQTITFTENPDQFIVKSEKDGYCHLYMYSIEKGEIKQITSGNYDVSSLLGLDNENEVIYYMSKETSPLKNNLYSIKFNGKDKKRLTTGEGNYRISPSKGFKYYLSFFSNATTPNVVTLHTFKGDLVRELENNAELAAKIEDYELPLKEFFTFTTSEGVELNGYIIKPNNFDPAKEYPLFMTQYSGPGSQSVSDSFSVSWEQVLVQDGYIVACVDGRGTGARGEEFKKCTYGNLGKYEVIDQIEAAKYLGSLPYINKDRIAIYGWSYGGFMALNCILKGNDVFKLAVAVAPVTSWRYYDTIYTELYNGIPQLNPEGYDDNSPVNFAKELKGKLLIAHGTGDDNVHIQNSYEMIEALVKAGKDFDMAIYPDKNHGMGTSRNHLMRKTVKFVKENL